jgi:hypothetical protein
VFFFAKQVREKKTGSVGTERLRAMFVTTGYAL